jgi:multiple sugar transport system ATP-binding protein
MTSVSLEHVTKQFVHSENALTVTALDEVSLKIPSGDVLAILGPSGCGKSTLLRIVAGLLSPDSGQILYNNAELNTIPMSERGIGMVFQEGALMPHWKAVRSVGFFLRLRQREHEVPERIRRIAKITGLGLEKLLDRRPNQLSGGERQRVSIARALARDLNILLFDEPFANLDYKIRSEARVELKRLLTEFPVTSIYVTHDQTEAIALSHRIAVMRQGKFVQAGTFQQLYNSPINMFVAGFIGTPTMSFFPGRVNDGQWWGENHGGYAIRNDLPNGTPVSMGIRAQHVYLKNAGLPAVVEKVTPYWGERYQLVEVWLGKDRWELTLPLDHPVEVGSTIYTAFDPEGAMYFDTKRGNRIG